MNRKQRVFTQIGGTLTEISQIINRYREGGDGIVALDDSSEIYIGAELPFNHRYIEVSTGNNTASVMSAEIWNNTSWQPVIDFVDETSDDGKTLAQSGNVVFVPDPENPGWAHQWKSKEIAALADGPQILDLYWCRLSFSVTIDNPTKIKYIGQKFSTDEDLFDLYPDLNRTGLMTAFASGKTDWTEQAIVATELITDELRQRRVLFRREQIMDSEILREACIHKTAEIIYRGLGNGHLDNRIIAGKDYKNAMNNDFFEVDLTGDGRASFQEKRWSSSFGTR